ncbi:integrin alpha [Oscillatoria sp. CS-180]|uniref:beta strand repeat-containing protein n=1 Tax=Oscillatoria sp. CS-180 TaxID=3021720 RepID=UPI00232C3FE9|nr:integrin alpha [Oscillatoria sp. CS-180]MDB9525842.1 integrin alpha [Oscillatoria sp. CS-180]
MVPGSVLNLSDLNGINGFVISGIDPYDYSGAIISDAGDVNDDGFDDVIIGSYGADPNGLSDAGESYVIFGTDQPFSKRFELADLNGENGFVLSGINSGDRSGRAVSSVGDVNNDGIDDLIVGAYTADPNGLIQAGQTYVVFGSSTLGTGGNFALSDLNGINGFIINGIAQGDRLGRRAVAGAGDINGDGIDDFIVGAYGANSEAGQSYVIFGDGSLGKNGNFDLTSLNGDNGFVLNSVRSGERSGFDASGLGDINGDGLDDLIVGSHGSGRAYVVFGSDQGFSESLDLADLNGINGFTVYGFSRSRRSFARSVSGASDINADGFQDVLIGERDAGKTYILFGSASVGNAGSFDVRNLDGSNGFVADGGGFSAGGTARSAGDINGDDISDIIIGADRLGGTGGGYIIYGGTSIGETGVLDLFDIDGSDGLTIRGVDQFDFAGWAVNNAGDFNNDGFDDFLITAPFADPDRRSEAGESYIVFGRKPSLVSLVSNATTVGESGGVARLTVSRRLEDIAGDLSVGLDLSGSADAADYRFSDGVVSDNTLTVIIPDGQTSVDVLIAAIDDSRVESTEFLEIELTRSFTYVNAPESDTSTIAIADNDLSEVNIILSIPQDAKSRDLFQLDGFTVRAPGRFGFSVSDAGDINGDGIDDVVIGAPGYGSQSTAGTSHVIFGSDKGFDSTLNPSEINGSNGFVINGINIRDRAGQSVSGAGDVNGDGFDDIIIGAPFVNTPSHTDVSTGASYVVFGAAQGFGTSFNLADLDGSNGFVLEKPRGFDRIGTSVSSAGDFNNDGIDDIIIGGPGTYGESYVVFGSDKGFDASFDLSNLDSRNGFTIYGIRGRNLGTSVSNAGDVNGDGIDDVIISESGFNSRSYVIFGSHKGFDDSLDLATLDGTNGFAIFGTDKSNSLGFSVSGAGDINGDGLDDVIIGARGADPNGESDSGESYVVFGSDEGFDSALDLSLLNGQNGFAISGVSRSDQSGSSVSGVGDVNGDGLDDLIIGALEESYIVFGAETFASHVALSALNGDNGLVITGNQSSGYFSSANSFVSNAGDINSDGIADFIVGSDRRGVSRIVFGSPTLKLPQNSFLEGGAITLSVYRSNGSSGDVEVVIDLGGTANFNDYRVFGGIVEDRQLKAIIPDGQEQTDIVFRLTDDDRGEDDETITVSISDSSAYTIGSEGTSHITIVDNDVAPALESITRHFPIDAATDADTLVFRAAFSKAVQNVGAEDFTAIGTTATVMDVTQMSDSEYDVMVSGGDLAALTGMVGLDLASTQDIADLEGNVLTDSEPLINETYTVAKQTPRSPVFTFRQYVQFQALDEGVVPTLDEELYLLANSDVKTAVDSGDLPNGFQHYSLFGASEGRPLLPLNLELGGLKMADFFDETYYLAQNPDVARGVNQGLFTYGFEHFLKFGLAEGRNPSSFYNEVFYLENNLDVKSAVKNGVLSSGLTHFVQIGHVENRIASEQFDPQDYLSNHSDAQAAIEDGVSTSGFDYYLEHGSDNDRFASLLYEEAFYLEQNPEVADAVNAKDFESGFEHYVSFGQHEGRNPSSLFDEGAYLRMYPDVASAVDNNNLSSGFEHYFRFGRAEGRALV